MIMLQWRRPPPLIRTVWRGPEPREAVAELAHASVPLAAIIGPPGSPGPAPRSGRVVMTLPGGGGEIHAEHSFAAPGLTPAMRAFATLELTDDDAENSPEWLVVTSLAARAGQDSITILITLAEPASGPIPLIWSAF
ncbi:MAG: hypothetical protein IPN84_14635 [Sphingomonadales bacterium]|nr:hypothetical protein [Sphingomonadales bacterium]